MRAALPVSSGFCTLPAAPRGRCSNMRRAGIFVMRQARTGAALFLCAFLTVAPAIAGQIADPAAHLDSLIAAAESALRDGELAAAESRYRSALEAGWILAGALAAADRQLPAAIDAFRTAATSVADAVSPLRLLAIVYLQHGEAEDAVRVLSDLSMRRPADAAGRRLLSQALVAAGRLPEAIQQLEEARAQAPDDLELAFALASGYVRVNKVGDADRLFREIASAR